MKKEDFIKGLIENINKTYSDENKHKFKIVRQNEKVESVTDICECSCGNNMFYEDMGGIICDECFNRYCIDYNHRLIKIK